MLAPTVGPYVGGWITETYDWPWLFLINLGPGFIAIGISAWLLPRQATELGLVRTLDYPALTLMAIALTCLEIGLKEAPQRGWLAWPVLSLLAAIQLIAMSELGQEHAWREAHGRVSSTPGTGHPEPRLHR